eukprot:gene10888-11042_t
MDYEELITCAKQRDVAQLIAATGAQGSRKLQHVACTATAQVLQTAPELLSSLSGAVVAPATVKRIIKRAKHRAGGRAVGKKLLGLCQSSSTVPTSETSQNPQSDFLSKYKLRFGDADGIQQLIDCNQVTVAEALAQSCRSEPSLFLRQLRDNLDVVEWHDNKVTTALQVFVQRIAGRPEDSAALISLIQQALVNKLDVAQPTAAALPAGCDGEPAAAAGAAIGPFDAAAAAPAAAGPQVNGASEVLPGVKQQVSQVPAGQQLLDDAWMPSYWDAADPDDSDTAEQRLRQQRMHRCLAAVTPALSMLVRAHPEAALGLFGVSKATKTWLLEHGLPKALLAKGTLLAQLATSGALQLLLPILLQPTAPLGHRAPAPWGNFSSLDPLRKLCHALRPHPDALIKLYQQMGQLLQKPGSWRWQQNDLAVAPSKQYEGQLVGKMSGLEVQDSTSSGDQMVVEDCQQQQLPGQQQIAVQGAMAILPEDVLKEFPLELQAHHAAAVADSCDAMQLLLLPAYCFLLLTEEHQNKCIANITDTLQQEILGWRKLAQPCISPATFSQFVQQHRRTIRPAPAELLQLLRSFMSHQLRAEARSDVIISLDDWVVEDIPTVPSFDRSFSGRGKPQLLDLFPYPDLLEGTAQQFAAAVAPRLSLELLLTVYQSMVFDKLSLEVRRDLLLKLHKADRLESLVDDKIKALKLLASAGCFEAVYKAAWPMAMHSDPDERCEGWPLLFTAAAVSGDQAHRTQLFKWVDKRIHKERQPVRAYLLGHLLELIRDGHITVKQLSEWQLGVLLSLGRNVLHARDCKEHGLVLQLAASFLSDAAGSAGAVPHGPSSTKGAEEWPGVPGSQQFLLTGCAADLVAEVMLSTSDWGGSAVSTGGVQDTQRWSADWGQQAAAELPSDTIAASQAGTSWGRPAAVAGWMPPLPLVLRDLSPMQREAWFFAVAEAAEAVLRHRQQQWQLEESGSGDVGEDMGGAQLTQQQQQQQAAKVGMKASTKDAAAAGREAPLLFKRITRPGLSSSSCVTPQPSPALAQQQPPSGLPSWLPRLFWDAEYVEPLLLSHHDLLQLLANVLLEQLQYIPGKSDQDQLLLDNAGSAVWRSAAVDAAVGQLLKVLCLHISQVQGTDGQIFHQLLPLVKELNNLLLQDSGSSSSSSLPLLFGSGFSGVRHAGRSTPAPAKPSALDAVANLADGQAAVVDMLLHALKGLFNSLLWISPVLAAGLQRSMRSYSVVARLLQDEEAHLANEIKKLDPELPTDQSRYAFVKRRKMSVEKAKLGVMERLKTAIDLWVVRPLAGSSAVPVVTDHPDDVASASLGRLAQVLLDGAPEDAAHLYDAWSSAAIHAFDQCQLEALVQYFSQELQRPSALAVGAAASSQVVRTVSLDRVLFQQQLQEQRKAQPSDAVISALSSVLTCGALQELESISSTRHVVELLLVCGGKGATALQAAVADMVAKLPDLSLGTNACDVPVPLTHLHCVVVRCIEMAKAADRQHKQLTKMLCKQEHKQTAAAAAAAAVGSYTMTTADTSTSNVKAQLQVAVARADTLLQSLQRLLVSNPVLAVVQRCLLQDWRFNEPDELYLETWLQAVLCQEGMQQLLLQVLPLLASQVIRQQQRQYEQQLEFEVVKRPRLEVDLDVCSSEPAPGAGLKPGFESDDVSSDFMEVDAVTVTADETAAPAAQHTPCEDTAVSVTEDQKQRRTILLAAQAAVGSYTPTLADSYADSVLQALLKCEAVPQEVQKQMVGQLAGSSLTSPYCARLVYTTEFWKVVGASCRSQAELTPWLPLLATCLLASAIFHERREMRIRYLTQPPAAAAVMVVTVQQLQPFLDDDEPQVASIAMACLGHLDAPGAALPLLLDRLAGPAAAEAAAALRVIFRLKPADVVAAFESLLIPSGGDAVVDPSAAADAGAGGGKHEPCSSDVDQATAAPPGGGGGGAAMKVVAQKDAIRMLEEAELPEAEALLLRLMKYQVRQQQQQQAGKSKLRPLHPSVRLLLVSSAAARILQHPQPCIDFLLGCLTAPAQEAELAFKVATMCQSSMGRAMTPTQKSQYVSAVLLPAFHRATLEVKEALLEEFLLLVQPPYLEAWVAALLGKHSNSSSRGGSGTEVARGIAAQEAAQAAVLAPVLQQVAEAARQAIRQGCEVACQQLVSAGHTAGVPQQQQQVPASVWVVQWALGQADNFLQLAAVNWLDSSNVQQLVQQQSCVAAVSVSTTGDRMLRMGMPGVVDTPINASQFAAYWNAALEQPDIIRSCWCNLPALNMISAALGGASSQPALQRSFMLPTEALKLLQQQEATLHCDLFALGDEECGEEGTGATQVRQQLVNIILSSWRSWEVAATTATMLQELLQASGLTAQQVASQLARAVEAAASRTREVSSNHSLSLRRPLMVEHEGGSRSAGNSRVASAAWRKLAEHLLGSAGRQQAPVAAAMPLLSLAVVVGAAGYVGSTVEEDPLLQFLVWASSSCGPTRAATPSAGSGDCFDCPESRVKTCWWAVQTLQALLRPGKAGASWLQAGCLAAEVEVGEDVDVSHGAPNRPLREEAWNPMNAVMDFLRP